MKSPRVCVLLFTLFVSANAVGFRGFTYEGLKEPKGDRSRSKVATERWIEQPVDHFNARDNRTWSMRYYENDEFLNGTGPLLIMLGGEWAIGPGFVEGGLMYNIGKEQGAIMYYTEHRYYGESHPVEDSETENLQYLNVDQALADVAYFIETMKKENPGLANSRVVVFGGSYAGNMATWAKIKYPHLIQGAVASSAPVRAKADFFEYYEVVARSLARTSEQCVEDVEEAFNTVEVLLGLTDGPEVLKTFFNLCEAPNATYPSDIGYFMMYLIEKFAVIVQYNKMGENGTSTIGRTCDTMTDKSIGSPVMRLVKLVSGGLCLDVSYDNFVASTRKTSWLEASNMRFWVYQTCTEYGYYQTTSSNHSIFGTLVPLEFYGQICSDIYGKYYNLDLLDSKVRRTNIMYGGSLPDVANVVFTNGNVDPWYTLSVLEDLNENSPAILVDGSSHCEDLYDDNEFDVPGLTEARQRVRSLVAKWFTSE